MEGAFICQKRTRPFRELLKVTDTFTCLIEQGVPFNCLICVLRNESPLLTLDAVIPAQTNAPIPSLKVIVSSLCSRLKAAMAGLNSLDSDKASGGLVQQDPSR